MLQRTLGELKTETKSQKIEVENPNVEIIVLASRKMSLCDSDQ